MGTTILSIQYMVAAVEIDVPWVFSGRHQLPEPSVIISKAANGYHFKTRQREAPGSSSMFYPAACAGLLKVKKTSHLGFESFPEVLSGECRHSWVALDLSNLLEPRRNFKQAGI